MADGADERYDAVVVGASLAGSATAIGLARAGARVALVERSPDPAAFKRVCGHFIQAGAVPAIERLGLLDPMLAAGAVRSRTRMWTPEGRIFAPEQDTCINLRREKLDPLVREAAAATPGVELLLGRTVRALLRDGDAVAGVQAAGRDGRELRLRAPLTVGADGRASAVAGLAGVRARTSPHGRFSYGAYYEGPAPEGAPDGTVWFLDPDWAAAFPTDDGLVLYAAMPTHDRLDAFRDDLPGALEAFVGALPDAPPIAAARRVSPVFGKVRMPNVVRDATAPGLALVGDAAVATDPLWGVGCGWAFQTAEWLTDAAAPALGAGVPLGRALARYRRVHRRRLAPHLRMIHGYAGGRPLDAMERTLYRAGARDQRVAAVLARIGHRSAGPFAVASPAVTARIVRAGVLGGRRPPEPAPALPVAA